MVLPRLAVARKVAGPPVVAHRPPAVMLNDRRSPGRPMTDLLDRREARIRRMFDGIAPKYDLLNHLLSLNTDKAWRRRVARTVPATAGPVLDLCTGTGDLAFEYDRASGGRLPIVGADFAGEMLGRAVEKSRQRGSEGRIGFVQADA